MHCCLKRHGISRLPEAESKKTRRYFKIGSCHIDSAEVRTGDRNIRLFVAIDRTSKFACVELHQRAGKINAAEFLRTLIATVPYKIHTILSDNGSPFTNRKRDRFAFEHIFGRLCKDNGIDHRLTKVTHRSINS